MKLRVEEGLFPGLNKDNFMEVWSAAIMLLHCIMQFLSHKSGLVATLSTHPSAETRFRYGLSYTAGDKVAFGDDALALDRAVSGIDEVRKWWFRSGAPTYRFDRMIDPTDEAVATIEDLNRMRDDLSKLQQERKARLLGPKSE
jgi:hypothetical protein